ncbi:glycosyltransferase family 2 protein, partial [Enterococcus lactis]|uniref:glycosyltransferase family 2 protein n=1 Tax=Enterococcus lactis TaxID=357441 RepID=UPI0039082794
KTDVSSGSPALPRNIGIDNASGDVIAFLDADDIWLPDKLSEQVRFMNENGCVFVYSDYEKIDAVGNRNNRKIRMPLKSSFW